MDDNCNEGAFIPYSSGGPIELSTDLNGVSSIPAFIGFGNSAVVLEELSPLLDLTGSLGLNSNFAFSVPRNCTLNAMAAYFSSVVPLNLSGSVFTITAQLYASKTPNNIFMAVPGASVTLPPYSGPVTIGQNVSALAQNLYIGFTAGTRLLLVFYANSAGKTLNHSMLGYASAGLDFTKA